uniref:efflux RND transporter periplasmic adaptor subunit n=1 Tax=uncultured Halomonas sp. TaxID=173971 RepID=UPI00262B4D7C|nr:efflux RND transporter periplasmic adaptor subunit [uncultured Halomonas sp.]
MKRKLIRSLPLAGALVLAAAVILYVQGQARALDQAPPRQPRPPAGQPEPSSGQPESQAQHATVSVVTVETDTYASHITAYGEATAHYELTLSAQVDGLIEALTDDFEAGNRVAQGDLLASVEDTRYQEALATAQNTLASARVSLLEEERQGEQASTEWQASGLSGEPDSPLVLRAPQLASARAAAAEAQAAVEAARQDLEQTHITAPFDAQIIARSVVPGSYVQTGTEIATLVSTDRMEISVSLSAEQWSHLPGPSALASGDWPVALTHVESGQQWTGHVIRTRQHLDSTSRQRSLVIAVPAPFDQSPALLPGTFVEASLAGKAIDGLWKLPSTALSQSGKAWYVTDHNTLANFDTTPVFISDDAIFIDPPAALEGEAKRVVRQPLSSYVNGMAVNPIEEQSDV